MTKQEYFKKAEEIIKDSHDCAEWSCDDSHGEQAEALYNLHIEGVREIEREIMKKHDEFHAEYYSTKRISEKLAGQIYACKIVLNLMREKLK